MGMTMLQKDTTKLGNFKNRSGVFVELFLNMPSSVVLNRILVNITMQIKIMHQVDIARITGK